MNFLVFLVTTLSLFQFSLQANCTVEDLNSLGFLPIDLKKEDSGTLMQTHSKLTSAGKKMVSNRNAFTSESLANMLHPGLDVNCSQCFLDSIACSIEKCKARCMSNECSKGCQQVCNYLI